MSVAAPNTAAAEAVPESVALVQAAAQGLGLAVEVLDAEYGHLFCLSDGTHSVTLLGGRSPLNDAVAARICEDKFYTGMLLAHAGHRVPATVRCLKPGHFQHPRYEHKAGAEPAWAFAGRHGYPVVVKPNRLSHGRCVSLAADETALRLAIDTVWRHDYLALVQEPCPGNDIRLDYLDGELLVAYRRRSRLGLSDGGGEDGIPLLNLAQNARAEVLETVPPALQRYAIRVGETLNLRFFGVDLRVSDLQQPDPEPVVIEVNASPLLVQLWKQGYSDMALAAQKRVLKAVWEQAT